ncbi:MAG: response regulator [Vicinamibacterales bacterium]
MGTPFSFALNSPVLREPIPNRVLVVDDEPLIRWSLCTALEAAGFDAVAAASGVEARRLANEWPPPRLVLVDLAGAEDTRELLDFVRRIYPDCKFVLMTTARQHDLRHDGVDVQVIEKPFDLHNLVTLITRLVDEPSVSPHPAGA